MKDLILDKALELYNNSCYHGTGLKEVADALGKEESEVKDFFPTKKDLIVSLYDVYEEEMDLHMNNFVSHRTVLSVMYTATEATFTIMQKYRFIFINQTEIFKNIPELSNRASETQYYRDQEYYQVIKKAVSKGLLREEEFKDEYLRLSQRINLMGDYWINQSLLLRKYEGKTEKHYCGLLFEVVYPYLTDEGKVEYWKTV